MAGRQQRVFRLKVFSVFVDNLFLCDGLNGFFDLQKSMVVLDFLLAVAAKIVVVAENALVANAKDAEVVFAPGANNVVN